MYRILVADDEKEIRESIADFLRSKSFSVQLAENGCEACRFAKAEPFDLILLDVRMPQMDGIAACKKIRQFSHVPVLFLSAFGEEQEMLRAFQSGCDDYIVKPFPLSILYEKCSAMIRRSRGDADAAFVTVGQISIDTNARKVLTPQSTLSLSRIDYELLLYLAHNKGIVLNRELILTRVWGYDFDGDARVVDTHIKRIRKALGPYAAQIKTKPGAGYCMEEV